MPNLIHSKMPILAQLGFYSTDDRWCQIDLLAGIEYYKSPSGTYTRQNKLYNFILIPSDGHTMKTVKPKWYKI